MAALPLQDERHHRASSLAHQHVEGARCGGVVHGFQADTAFQKNENNIHEPMDGTVTAAGIIDMVFVPMLIFDTRGYRIGYGKGFYDKYLDQCRPDCIKVGFCYFDPVDKIEDTHDFDVPLNLCITPQKVYVF